MKTETLAYAIGNIDERLIERAEKPVSRRPRYLRYIAAAAAVLLVLGAAFGVVKAAGEKANIPEQNASVPETIVPEDAVLPPARIGTEGNTHTTIRGPLTMSSVIERSDAVCILTIGNWIGEDEDETFFEATVENVLCGELPERITVCQHGNSSWSINGFPILTYGDRLLAFLCSVTWNAGQSENCYTFTGVQFSHYYIESTNDGNEFAIDMSGVFSHYAEREPGFNVKNHSGDVTLIHRLINSLRGYDDILADWLTDYWRMLIKDEVDPELSVRIYELSELEQYITAID